MIDEIVVRVEEDDSEYYLQFCWCEEEGKYVLNLERTLIEGISIVGLEYLIEKTQEYIA